MNNKIVWSRRTYTEQEFIESWNNSLSIAECARRLNLTIYGGTYKTLKYTAEFLNLSSNHMTGQGWNKDGIKNPSIKPIEYYLVENGTITSSSLKNKLLKAKLLENKCYAPYCPVPNPTVNPFTGEIKELKLSLDHINGVNNDNRIENLRLLCYHCHGETETWCRGKNKKQSQKSKQALEFAKRQKYLRNMDICECGELKSKKAKTCMECRKKKFKCECGKSKSIKSKLCLECANNKRKRMIIDSPEDILEKLNKGKSYVAIGKDNNVSDNAIRKFLIRNNIQPPKCYNK